MATGTGVAILAGCAAEAPGAAATAGMVCIGSAVAAKSIADAQKFQDPALKSHEALQEADKQLRERAQQFARALDNLARQRQEEDLRHQKVERQLADAEKRQRERNQPNMKSSNAQAREIEQRLSQEDRRKIEQELKRHAEENARLQKQIEQQRQQYRRDANRIVDSTTDDKLRRQREKQQVEQQARDIEQRSLRPTINQPSPVRPDVEEERRLQRIEDFKREWEGQWARYLGLGDGWWAQWRFEQDRHARNPFQTAAEAARHNTEVARLNNLSRCMFADHLAKLDEIRLKYRSL